MKVAILKYNAGNIMSVDFALQRMGIQASITNNHEEVMAADKVIFPGVGEASTTMKYLRERKLDQLLKNLKQPVLGICLGLQLMCQSSAEGQVDCIGIFEENVSRFVPGKGMENITKVPHMGWNALKNTKEPLFSKNLDNQYVYFVHSYYAEKGKNTVATANYINDFSASLQKGNFFATQFHPEKSGKVGAQILKNFIEL